MLQQAKNIVRACIVGFLLLGVSGVTIVIHHDHPIPPSSPKHTEQPNTEQTGEAKLRKPSTYHEVHFLRLGSDDDFTIFLPTESRVSVTGRFVIPTVSFDLFPNLHSAVLLNAAAKETPLSSRDTCALFCSFLI